ncbi:hypothetical protein AVHY2522_03720 [Acidovorax sp. SUPP2522]|uniref:hypothetical protein n=1 Tax=unclassified Acidovorax TaxID=2684926 RepID=UPI0023498E09|nr:MULTISPECIES: hypothetical protein [unclassified Acidovorax]WCM86427.1 hypothetical protein M5C98_13610 [Acidovorax sp. NCPPB 3576]WCM99665.1 hypothetical protein M5C96_09825 [Acidovorax sp. GBBC 1281]GKS86568.1 hypothetical protein AVMA1855_20470 [Acidovorax sp. SUPP1855]GKT14211.1 hypothetical protein AVHY2522_03720 [Acidovorax sp. SUPP2522]
MTYHLQLNAALGPEMNSLGAVLDARSTSTWIATGLVFAVEIGLFEVCRRNFAKRWSATQEAIERVMQLGVAGKGRSA